MGLCIFLKQFLPTKFSREKCRDFKPIHEGLQQDFIKEKYYFPKYS